MLFYIGSEYAKASAYDFVDKYFKGNTKVRTVCQFVLDVFINSWRQRIRNLKIVKVHRYDAWNLYGTLALIILPALKKLKETKHGSPYVENEDVPEHLRDQKENEYDFGPLVHEKWAWVLDEMIFAFEHIVDDSWQDEFRSGEIDFEFEEQENGNYLLVDGPNHTYVCDYEGMKKVEDRIRNGLTLFGKYYQGLWD